MVIIALGSDPGPELDPDPRWPKMIDSDPLWNQCGSTTLRETLALNFLPGQQKKKFIKKPQGSEGGGEGWEGAWLNRLEGAGHSCLKNWLGNWVTLLKNQFSGNVLVLIRLWIRGSIPVKRLSGSCSFFRWLSRCQNFFLLILCLIFKIETLLWT